MTNALFDDLATADREALFAVARPVEYAAGDTVLREGEAGTKLFLIDAGVVAITRQHGAAVELLSVLTKGEYFGEMALLTVEPRSATARAVEPCRCTVLTHDDFQRFAKQHPQAGALVYRNFAMTLSERVRRLTERFERLHPRSAAPPTASAAHTRDRQPPETGNARLITPAVLIKGIVDLLQEKNLPGEQRTYFETVLKNQVTELAGWLKTHG